MATGALSQALGRYSPTFNGVTDLVVTGVTFPDYAVRGVRVRVSFADEASRLARTVNGVLRNLSEEIFRKRVVIISGNDVEFPYLADVWPGHQVTVTTIISASQDGALITVTGLVKEFELEKDEYGQVASWSIEIWEI